MTVADRRRREREARRNHILDAAEQVFLERGYDVVTVDDIAVAAEVAKGTLYLYFKNKYDLLLALMHRRRLPLLQVFAEAQADASSGLDLVARLIRAQHKSLSSDAAEFRRLFLRHMVDDAAVEKTPESEQHLKFVERIINTYRNALERDQHDGSIRKDLEVMMVTSQIWGGVVGSLILAQHGDRMAKRFNQRFEIDEYGQSLVDLIVRSIQAQPTAGNATATDGAGEIEA